MKKLGFRSIKSTILFGGFAIITLICLTILSISSMLSYNAFREQVEEDMQVISKQVSEKLIADIKTTETVIEDMATNPMLSDGRYTDEEVASFFEQRAQATGFKLFFTVAETGKGINLTHEAETFDVSDTEYFKRSIKGETYTSAIIDDVVTGEKIMVISTPQISCLAFLQVLKAQISFHRFARISNGGKPEVSQFTMKIRIL